MIYLGSYIAFSNTKNIIFNYGINVNRNWQFQSPATEIAKTFLYFKINKYLNSILLVSLTLFCIYSEIFYIYAKKFLQHICQKVPRTYVWKSFSDICAKKFLKHMCRIYFQSTCVKNKLQTYMSFVPYDIYSTHMSAYLS